jgi:teichuronic acid biosynthesis glycosyltransferase TuaC
MKVLIMTAMWPTAENPAFGSFIRAQVECLKKAGVEIDVMALDGRIRKLIYPRGVVELARRLRSEAYDVVHAHYGYVGMVARTQWKVPVVVTFHGDDALGTINSKGKHTAFSRFVAGCGHRLGSMVDAVIVQSRQMAQKFRGANVHIIPHEVDLELFRPTDRTTARSELGLSLGKRYVLFAANPAIPVKRYPLAAAAVHELRKTDPAVEMIVVYREPQARLALYMSACDALVFPSYQEGSPNVVKQAMACNLPIVATAVGDVPEIVGGISHCRICKPDASEFASALQSVLREQARTDGRERVRWLAGPLVARQVIEVYEQAAGTTRRMSEIRQEAV